MSCGPSSSTAPTPIPKGVFSRLTDEGFRLFFPLSAIYAGLFPVLWVTAWGFDLPLARSVPPSLWHGHEMLVGAFGAALIGFLTTAVPEWTDTEPPRGRPLTLLAAVWACGRCIGLLGWDGLSAVGALADLAWIAALLVWVLRLSWQRRTDRLLAFAFWLALLLCSVSLTRYGFAFGKITWAETGLQQIGLAYLGLLGLALSRITVPVTNLILDPTEATSPFRPHPGRMNLAPGLVVVAMASELLAPSFETSGFVLIAVGAAFMDRVGESFIGRAALHTEILLLAGVSGFAGAGLMVAGAARLGAGWGEIAGWHLAYMGGLGLGVYAVFTIAGLLHSGENLGPPRLAKLGAVLLVGAVFLRVAPEFGWPTASGSHTLSSLCWAAGFSAWLVAYWPLIVAGFPDDRARNIPENKPDFRAANS